MGKSVEGVAEAEEVLLPVVVGNGFLDAKVLPPAGRGWGLLCLSSFGVIQVVLQPDREGPLRHYGGGTVMSRGAERQSPV